VSVSECAPIPPHPGPELLGRTRELAALRGLVQGACGWPGRALVLRGEPGSGKSALLAAAVRLATGRRVLRVTGIEAEAGLAWAALHRLVLAFAAELGQPSDAERTIIEDAIGTGRGPSHGQRHRQLVESAVLALVTRAVRQAGLLCIVDDLQWVDHESRAVLHQIAQRARAIPLVLVAAICEPAPVPALASVPELAVTGLPADAGAELLMRRAGGVVDRRTAGHITRLAGGNPLALSATGRLLAGGRADVLDILCGQGLPGRSLPDPIVAELRMLPASSRALLTLAACASGRETRCLWRAAATLGIGPEALAPARRAGVVRPGPDVRFRHPLLRAAALDGVSPEQWRSAHQALAQACDPETDSTACAWHRVAAAGVPDDDLAAELAHRAQHPVRGRPALPTVSYLTQAARRSATGAAGHYLAASAAALAASTPRLADDLLRRARAAGGTAAQQAQAERLEARLNHAFRPPAGESSRQMLSAAARLTGRDRAAGLEAMHEAAQLAITTGRYTRGTTARAIGSALLRMSEPGLPGLPPGALLPGLATLLSGDYRRAVPLLRRALQAKGTTWPGLPGAAAARVYAARALWYDEPLLTRPGTATRPARCGAGVAPSSHDLSATLACWSAALAGLGRLTEAGRLAGRARRLAQSIGGSPALLASLEGAELLAWQGAGPAAERAAHRLVAAGADLERADLEHSGTAALMTLHLSRCQYAQAFAAAEKLSAEDLGGYANQALSVLVEAGTRLGRGDETRRAFGELAVRASASGTAWALGALSLCEALLASEAEAADCYERSIALLDTTGVIGERARARLLYGEWLRRKRRRIAARHWLAAASRLYRDMGAVDFGRRAQRELDTATPSRRAGNVPALPATAPMLTRAEWRVAELAAAGATNKEIAVELFVSRRTVDHHLRNTYGKLGLRSRRQLGAALPRFSTELSGRYR